MRNNRLVPAATEKLVNIYSKLKAAAAAARDDKLTSGIMNDVHCTQRAGEDRVAACLHTAAVTAHGVGTCCAAAEVRTLATVYLGPSTAS